MADRPRRSGTSLDTVTDDETPTPQVSGSAPEKRERGFWRELPALIVIALVIAILIKTFLVQAFYIPSQSMEPTLNNQRVRAALQGAIGGFLHWLGEGIGVAQPENPDFIKRVIGLPGDTVEITRGVVYVNGQRLDEPYLDPQSDDRSFPKETVPDGMLYVLGDNRAHSGDSRFEPPEGLGWVPIDVVIGKAFVTVWPPGRWRWL